MQPTGAKPWVGYAGVENKLRRSERNSSPTLWSRDPPGPRTVGKLLKGFNPSFPHPESAPLLLPPPLSRYLHLHPVIEARIHQSCLARLSMARLLRTSLLSLCSPPHSAFSAN